MLTRNILAKTAASIMLFPILAAPDYAQHVDRLAREWARVMLRDVASDVRKYYYDPQLHGIDWDAKVKDAEEGIANSTTRDELLLQIAALLETLNDSHTFFVPPHDPISPDYGWQFQMVGSHCYVTHVRPKSDAESKGVKPGDELVTINGFTPERASLSKIEYLSEGLLRQTGYSVEL